MKQIIILGKINPQLSLIQQDGLFNPTPTYITADYILAYTKNYFLGSNDVEFIAVYGNCTFNESNELLTFSSVYRQSITLSGPIISNWGEDDTIILSEIATEQGTTITEFITGNIDILDIVY